MTTTAARAVASPNRLVRQAAAVLLGSLAIAASAQVAIPLWPVPMTLQTLAVGLVAAALGARLGVAALLLYLAEGAVGLPVFANFSFGPGVLVGPTAGYLYGFVLAAALIGWAADRGLCRRALTALAPMTAGTLVIFAVGVAWLAAITAEPLAVGFWPFVPGAILKIALAAALAPRARDLAGSLLR